MTHELIEKVLKDENPRGSITSLICLLGEVLGTEPLDKARFQVISDELLVHALVNGRHIQEILVITDLLAKLLLDMYSKQLETMDHHLLRSIFKMLGYYFSLSLDAQLNKNALKIETEKKDRWVHVINYLIDSCVKDQVLDLGLSYEMRYARAALVLHKDSTSLAGIIVEEVEAIKSLVVENNSAPILDFALKHRNTLTTNWFYWAWLLRLTAYDISNSPELWREVTDYFNKEVGDLDSWELAMSIQSVLGDIIFLSSDEEIIRQALVEGGKFSLQYYALSAVLKEKDFRYFWQISETLLYLDVHPQIAFIPEIKNSHLIFLKNLDDLSAAEELEEFKQQVAECMIANGCVSPWPLGRKSSIEALLHEVKVNQLDEFLDIPRAISDTISEYFGEHGRADIGSEKPLNYLKQENLISLFQLKNLTVEACTKVFCASWKEAYEDTLKSKGLIPDPGVDVSSLYNFWERNLWNLLAADRLVLSSLALNGIKKNQITFSRIEINALVESKDQRNVTFDILIQIPFIKETSDGRYEFIHFSFQQFFAAQAVAKDCRNQRPNDLKEFICQKKLNPRYEMLWKFVASDLHSGQPEDQEALRFFWSALWSRPSAHELPSADICAGDASSTLRAAGTWMPENEERRGLIAADREESPRNNHAARPC